MKTNILFFFAILFTIGLTNCKNSNDDKLELAVSKEVAINTEVVGKIEKRNLPDFIYDVGPRFNPIKKLNIENAKSIKDLLDKEHLESIEELKSVSIIVVINDKRSDTRESGTSSSFNEAQLNLLQSFEYSTNFIIRTEYIKKNKETGRLEQSYSTPHHTIVPERQAEYSDGKKALMEFLKMNSKETWIDIDQDKFQPAKLFFTVTKTGKIKDVRLDRSSNFISVDNKMIELMSKIPGTWTPAENNEGEKVDQELVVSFGLMGC